MFSRSSEDRRTAVRRRAAAIGILASWLVSSTLAMAAPPEAIGVELNRLDDQGGNCRVSFVIANPGTLAFSGFKLDLVVFDRSGTIARRLAADVAPLRAEKTSVKIFDIPETPCAGIGSILINDVLDCRAGDAPVADCVARIATTTKLPVSLLK
jgi:hypothetical protein